MLSIGAVQANGVDRFLRAPVDLPEGPFALTAVHLVGNKAVTDAGLAHLVGCARLARLHLSATPVGDAGVAHLRTCTGLRTVLLDSTRVGDAGLAALRNCPDLSEVYLSHTPSATRGWHTSRDAASSRTWMYAGRA